MAMTKAERNKNQAQNRFNRRSRLKEGFKWQIIRLFDRARKERLTHTQILDYTKEWVWGSTAYQEKLTSYDREYLCGVWDACKEILWSELTDGYDHPDTNVLTETRTLLNAGLASRLNLKSYHKCY